MGDKGCELNLLLARERVFIAEEVKDFIYNVVAVPKFPIHVVQLIEGHVVVVQ